MSPARRCTRQPETRARFQAERRKWRAMGPQGSTALPGTRGTMCGYLSDRLPCGHSNGGRKNDFMLKLWHGHSRGVSPRPACSRAPAVISAEGAQRGPEGRHKVCTGMAEPSRVEKSFLGHFIAPWGAFHCPTENCQSCQF